MPPLVRAPGHLAVAKKTSAPKAIKDELIETPFVPRAVIDSFSLAGERLGPASRFQRSCAASSIERSPYTGGHRR